MDFGAGRVGCGVVPFYPMQVLFMLRLRFKDLGIRIISGSELPMKGTHVGGYVRVMLHKKVPPPRRMDRILRDSK